MRLHHTAIMASDLERSIDFYIRHFQFRLVERAEHAGESLAYLALAGGMIELVQGAGYPAEGIVNHVALAVDDLPMEMERLRHAGVHIFDVGPAAIFGGGRNAFCEGPDGELIELIEPPEYIAQA